MLIWYFSNILDIYDYIYEYVYEIYKYDIYDYDGKLPDYIYGQESPGWISLFKFVIIFFFENCQTP